MLDLLNNQPLTNAELQLLITLPADYLLLSFSQQNKEL